MPPPSQPALKTICLVSGSHVSSNPRLVKEADALHAAGHRVHVIAGRNFPPSDALDALILSRARWSFTLVDYSSGGRARVQRIVRRLARILLARFPHAPLGLAARAHHPAAAQLAAAASRIRADLYIGHTLVGLFAAASAARLHHARLGFDAEDFHLHETDAASSLPEEQHSIRRLESALLPRCVHLTAAAPLIAAAYASTYGIREPITVQNAFPLAEAPPPPAASAPVHDPVRFYWFSQTIGPGRGLESVVQLLARLKHPSCLSLRGTLVNDTYAQTLAGIARAAGFSGAIHFLPPAPSADMARLASEHDIGLAIEQSTPLNRDICLTNKLYTYLLAGIPIACTPTRAHLALAHDLGDAACVIDLDEPTQAAAVLDALLSDHPRYAAARLHARHLGQSRYNWENETPLLLSAVAQAVSTPLPGRRSAFKELARRALRFTCTFALRLRSRPLTLSPDGPTLVLAPHMDDEAFGCGALLAARLAAGARTHVAYFTDGSAGLGPHSPVSPSALIAIRQNEALTAMTGLGLDAQNLHFLNAPDGRLKHLSASERDHWRNVLADLIARIQPSEILLPSRSDGSSEHEAMFRLLAAALASSGARVRVLEFPVWSWWNPRFLLPVVFRVSRVWRVPVAPHAAAKSRLLLGYPSQTTLLPHQSEPALSPDFLASFRTSHEFFFESRLPS
jgi:LmbE family N-acetylglucosaminyl deacetylase/glycosyltransferase involved in cell wall biosynthesis